MTAIERNARWTAGSAIVLVAVAFAVSARAGEAAVAGAAVACGSAFLVQRLVLAFARAGDRVRSVLALVLVGKSAIVLGASAALLFAFRLDGLGFALGISALVTGALGAAISGVLSADGSAEPGAEPSPPPAAPLPTGARE